MATELNVGQTLQLSVAFLDQHGQPMTTQPSPDATPAWSQSSSPTATLAPSSDGLTAIEAAIAQGADTVSLTLAVGGHEFSATLEVTVNSEPQVLTSIEIVPGAVT
jgi:uncharacterized protein GlcG (DUF336 family)